MLMCTRHFMNMILPCGFRKGSYVWILINSFSFIVAQVQFHQPVAPGCTVAFLKRAHVMLHYFPCAPDLSLIGFGKINIQMFPFFSLFKCGEVIEDFLFLGLAGSFWLGHFLILLVDVLGVTVRWRCSHNLTLDVGASTCLYPVSHTRKALPNTWCHCSRAFCPNLIFSLI